MNFKKRLKAALEAHHLTASELARRTGVPKQTISDWLAGTSPRNMQHVRRVAEHLQVPFVELFFDPPPSDEHTRSDSAMKAYASFFFRNSIILLRILDLKSGYPVDLSPPWESVLGWSRDELKTKGWIDLLHLDDRAESQIAVEQLKSEHISHAILNQRLRHKSGKYIEFQSFFGVDHENKLLISISAPLQAKC